MKLRKIIMTGRSSGHRAKSDTPKPVLDMTETTSKVAICRLLTGEPASPWEYSCRATITEATIAIRKNVLDMTRFGRERIEPKREWVDLSDLVSAAFDRLGPTLKRFDVTVTIEREVALVYVQGALIEQALVNLLDNATDFSDPGDPIRVQARLVEDDAQIRKFLRISLEANGFEVHETRLGEQGVTLAGELKPDIIILDLGLPDIDGIDAIRRVREWSGTPIIVLSVRSDPQEKVAALDAGANDYVTKPFDITELMARIRVMLRTRSDAESDCAPLYRNDELEVDLVRRRVWRKGSELHLSRKEYDLLRLLVMHVGQVLTHQQILREIWGPAHAEDVHYLRVLVGSLRQKLGDDPTRRRYISTGKGVGYRLMEP